MTTTVRRTSTKPKKLIFALAGGQFVEVEA